MRQTKTKARKKYVPETPRNRGASEERIRRFKKAFEAKWLKEKIRRNVK